MTPNMSATSVLALGRGRLSIWMSDTTPRAAKTEAIGAPKATKRSVGPPNTKSANPAATSNTKSNIINRKTPASKRRDDAAMPTTANESTPHLAAFKSVTKIGTPLPPVMKLDGGWASSSKPMNPPSGSKKTRMLYANTHTAISDHIVVSRLVTGSALSDGRVRLWDASTGVALYTIGSSRVSGMAFSPDGAMLATAGADKTVRLWGVATGQLKQTLQGHTQRVMFVAYSPDGDTLASASSDQTARFKTFALLFGWSSVTRATPSPPTVK